MDDDTESYIDRDLFMKIEKLFTDHIYRSLPARITQYQNFCCDDEVERKLVIYGIKLKKHIPLMSLHDIYATLIYTYYSLVLNESSYSMNIKTLQKISLNSDQSAKLYYTITTNRIEYKGRDLASDIRRYMFGMTARGRKRNKKSKRVANKTKRTIKRNKKTRKRY